MVTHNNVQQYPEQITDWLKPHANFTKGQLVLQQLRGKHVLKNYTLRMPGERMTNEEWLMTEQARFAATGINTMIVEKGELMSLWRNKPPS